MLTTKKTYKIKKKLQISEKHYSQREYPALSRFVVSLNFIFFSLFSGLTKIAIKQPVESEPFHIVARLLKHLGQSL